MTKKIIFTLLGFSILLTYGCQQSQEDTTIRHKITMPNQQIFWLELANTPEKRKNGLMYRTNLKKNQGMLFEFAHEGYHLFWMKNVIIPLDIIFLDKSQRIIDIISAGPCEATAITCTKYKPKKKAQWVIELPQDSYTGGWYEKVEGDIFE